MRRRMLAASIILPGVALAGPAVESSISKLDFGSLYRKLRYRGDDGVLFWWLSGTKYAHFENEVTPLHELEACAIIRISTTTTGFRVTSLEHTFYTALRTGRPLEELKNPFTGELLKYKRTPPQPLTIDYRSDATFDVPSTMGTSRVAFNRSAAVLRTHGDQIWLQDDSSALVTSAAGTFSRANDWSTFRCNQKDILDARNQVPASTVHMQSVGSWQSWMNMGQRSGGLTSRIVGAKVRAFSGVPAVWRSLLEEFHPEVARDPIAALGA